VPPQEGIRVEAVGHHEGRPLLYHDGAYHRLWQKQSRFMVSEDGAQAGVDPAWLRSVHLFGVVPEMVLTGYPVEDLALRKSFVEASRISISRLAGRLAAAGLGDVVAVVGYLDRMDVPGHPKGGYPQNVAAVLHQGKIITTYAKHHLPNYGVFDEYRYFKPGKRFPVITIRGINFGVNVCEDIWFADGPARTQAAAGAEIIIAINASPYHKGKGKERLQMLAQRARENNLISGPVSSARRSGS
jgi:predicted amidohydrolase